MSRASSISILGTLQRASYSESPFIMLMSLVYPFTAGLRCRSTGPGIGGDCGRIWAIQRLQATSGPCLDLCLDRDPDLLLWWGGPWVPVDTADWSWPWLTMRWMSQREGRLVGQRRACCDDGARVRYNVLRRYRVVGGC